LTGDCWTVIQVVACRQENTNNQGLQVDQHHCQYFRTGALAVRAPLPPQPVPPLLYLGPSGVWTPSTIIVIIIWPPPAGRSSSAPAQPIAGPSPFCALGRLLWRVRVSLHTASATQPAPHPQPAPNLTYILRGSFNHHHPTSPSILRGDLLRSNERERERERETSHKLVLVREPLFVSNVRRGQHQRQTAKGKAPTRQFLGLEAPETPEKELRLRKGEASTTANDR
jgi:hypothetical protein